MNVLNLLTREEQVAGLEVSDEFLRLALLKFTSRKKTKLATKVLVETPLPRGAVVGGSIKDQEKFVKAVKDLLKKARKRIKYVIVSIPADVVYSRVFPFPRTVQGIKLEEAMKLIVDFQLPVKSGDVYLDWEKTEESETNESFLALISKSIIDDYTRAFKIAGLSPIAVEFYPMSFSRVADLSEKEDILITSSGKFSMGIFIIRGQKILFSRTVPFSSVPKKILSGEVRKVIDFYESEKNKISKTIEIKDVKAAELFRVDALGKKDGYKWLACVGAAWRGLLPREHDTIVSLMPVGTEDAYEYQKATAFAGLLSVTTIVIAIFFMAAFIAVWTMMVTIQRDTLNKIDVLISTPVQADLTEMENKAEKFNDLAETSGSILKVIPNWSVVFQELKSMAVSGIIINEISLLSSDSPLAIKGVAEDRRQLNSFKKRLDDSQIFTEVNLPFTNLDKRNDIPFSISFKLKDNSILYQF